MVVAVNVITIDSRRNAMSKKGVIWRVSLLLTVIVMAHLYYGCVHKHYSGPAPEYQTKDSAKLQEQEKQIEELQKELETLKKTQ